MLCFGLSMSAVGAAGTLADDGGRQETEVSVVTTTTRPTTTTESARDEPDVFFDRLAAAFVADDANTLVDLLHPAVVARYGEEQCREHLEVLAASNVELELVEVTGVGPVVYATDGQETTIDDGVRVRTRVTRDGEGVEQDATLAFVDDELRWFTDCGAPVTS